MAHVASVNIDTGAVLSDMLIETSGGSDPILCHGHRKRDAIGMKQLIERYQTEYYRVAGPKDPEQRRFPRLHHPPANCRYRPDRPISKRDTWTI